MEKESSKGDDRIGRKKSTRVFAPKIPSKPRAAGVGAAAKKVEIDNESKQKKGHTRERVKREQKKSNIIETAGIFSSGVIMEKKIKSDDSYVQASSKKVSVSVVKRENDEAEHGINNENNLEFLDLESDDKINVNMDLSYPLTLPITSNINDLIGKETDDPIKKMTDRANSKLNFRNEMFSERKDIPNNGYFLFQLPDVLPMSKCNSNYLQNEHDQIVDNKEEGLVDNESSDDFFDEINKIYRPNLSLNSINEDGCIGKLQKMKSGQIRMVLGNQTFDLEDAVQNCFLQELFVFEKSATSSGENDSDLHMSIADLGPIKHNFVCHWVVPEDKN